MRVGNDLKNSYEVRRNQFGWLVFGSMPLEDLTPWLQSRPENSEVMLDVAAHYGAALAVGLKGKTNAWRVEIESFIANLPPQERWLRGLHTGLSSLVIFSVLTDDEDLRSQARQRFGGGVYVPADNADFGRCHRLVTMMPGWSERLGEVAARYPESGWPKIVANWKELSADYEAGRSVRVKLEQVQK